MHFSYMYKNTLAHTYTGSHVNVKDQPSINSWYGALARPASVLSSSGSVAIESCFAFFTMSTFRVMLAYLHNNSSFKYRPYCQRIKPPNGSSGGRTTVRRFYSEFCKSRNTTVSATCTSLSCISSLEQ